MVGFDATNKRELVSGKKNYDEIPRTVTAIRVPGNSEIRNRILEGGRVLAALIEKDFPIADIIWPEVNQFNWMIDSYGLMKTWLIMITQEHQEVSNVALAFWLSFSQLLILYLVDCIAGNH